MSWTSRLDTDGRSRESGSKLALDSRQPATGPGSDNRRVSIATAAALPADEPEPDFRTIADLPFHVMGRFPKATLVGRCRNGGIDWLSSKEFFERVRDLSLGLSALGIGAGDRVVLLSESRPEWLLADLAILTAGGVTVPIYPTLSAEQGRYILQDSAAKAAIVSTRAQLEKIQEVRHQLPSIAAVALIDGWEPSDSPSVISLDAIAERGHERMTGEWGAAKEFRDAHETHPAGRPRDDHLHVGDDGRAEGRDAVARQPRLECPGGRRRAAVVAGGRRAVVPAAQPRVRADGRRTSTSSPA